MIFDRKKQQNSREMRTAALKQTLCRRCHVSQSHSSIDRATLPELLFHAPLSPLSNAALLPFLSLPLCLSFSLRRWLSIFLSLSTSDSEQPIVARDSPLPLLLSLSLCPFPLTSYLFLLPAYSSLFTSSFSFLHLCLSTTASPSSDTAVPSLPRTDAADLVQRHLYCPFFSLSSRLLPRSLLHFSLSIFLLLCSISDILQSLDKSGPIAKDSSVDDELGFLFLVLSDPRWLGVVRCLDVTS